MHPGNYLHEDIATMNVLDEPRSVKDNGCRSKALNVAEFVLKSFFQGTLDLGVAAINFTRSARARGDGGSDQGALLGSKRLDRLLHLLKEIRNSEARSAARPTRCLKRSQEFRRG